MKAIFRFVENVWNRLVKGPEKQEYLPEMPVDTFCPACNWSGSYVMTLIEDNEIIPALFGCRIGVLLVSVVFSPSKKSAQVVSKSWRKYALLSGACEMSANLFFMLAIANLELSKVGIFMASAPALAALIGIKLMKQKPLLINWLGIAATSGALIIIAVV